MKIDEVVNYWKMCDDKIKTMNDNIKPIREHKKKLETYIIDYGTNMNSNTDHSAQSLPAFELSDSVLSIQPSKTTTPISMKFIEKCLHDIIPNDNQVTQIINYIQSKRETTEKTIIKRSYPKT